MRPRFSARLLFAAIGAVACLLTALVLESLFSVAHVSRWVDDHETPVLLFFPHFSSETDRRLHEAQAHSGDVEITLTWNNLNDLDLHCIDPNGVQVYYGSRSSPATEGKLDVDRNMAPPYTTRPVEHIYWPRGRAPVGRYHVYVDHYARHGGADPTAYQVTVKEYGHVYHYSGQISQSDHIDGLPGRYISAFTAGRSEFAFLGLPPVFWRALLVIAAWAAALAAALCAALLCGLQLFYRRVYRRRLLERGVLARNSVTAAAWGAVAGVAAQTVYTFLPPAAIQSHPTWSHVTGLALLGAVVGLALGWRMPHVHRGWAFIAGIVGGAVGAWLFMLLYFAGRYTTSSEMWGRIATAAVLGAFIGFVIALIVEPPEEPEEPAEVADASLDRLQPLSLRANRMGPTGKLRRAGSEPVHR